MATSKAAAKKSKSDLKRTRQAVKRHARNSSILSRLKTEEKKLRSALQEGVTDVKALYAAFASSWHWASHGSVPWRRRPELMVVAELVRLGPVIQLG